MNNQDMPASPSTNWKKCEELDSQFDGETKYEKAYWQVFSVALTASTGSLDKKANDAIEATNAGFKALENK